MQKSNRFPRVILFLALLVSLLAGASAPSFVDESVRAAPMRASALDVIISEVAWGGTAANSADEWIELYNPTGSAINLSGWTLASNDLSPNIILSVIIPANGYYLLESDDDTTVSDLAADLIYTGSLINTGEILTLKDNLSNVIDTANNDGTTAWNAGSGSSTYYSMERNGVVADSLTAWTSNNGVNRNGLDSSGNPINGTPHNSKIDLSLTISVDNLTPSVGSNVVFTITVNNTGYGTATNVSVKDLLPAGLTYISDDGLGTYINGTGIWTVGSLANISSKALKITALVSTNGSFTNWAEVWTSDQSDPDSTPGNSSTVTDDDASATVTTPPADLSLTQTVNNPSATLGNNVIFTIAVTNAGPNPSTNVQIKDLLPSGLTFVSSSTLTGTYNSGTGIWNVGNLANSGVATLDITANVSGSVSQPNWAEVWVVDQYDPDSTPGNVSTITTEDDNASAPMNVDLSVTKTVNNSTPNVGDNVVFSVTVTNSSSFAATNVVIKDLLTGFTYVSDDGGGKYISGTGLWLAGTLSVGASKVLKITAQVPTNGLKTNTAQLFSLDQLDTNVANNSTNIFISPGGGIADLRVVQTYVKSTSTAGTVVLTITVNNTGPYNATNVIVKDKLPSGLTYVSDDGGGTYNKDTGLWSAGAISNPSNNVLKITAKVDTSGTLTNWAEVWSVDQSDPTSTPGDGSTTQDDDDSVTVASADLSITKSMDNVTPSLGQNVVFTIKVNNDGPDNATNVKVKDLLPSNFSYLSDDSGGNYINSTGIWTVGIVNNGSSRTLKLTATLVTGSLAVNWAEVWVSDQVDIDSVPGNSSTNTDDDASAPSADLRLTQTVIDSYPGLNTNFNFIITVSNDGTVGTSGVEVKDILPSGITYVSYTSSVGTYTSSTGIWTVGTIANGGSQTLNITAKMTTNGIITNWAEVWKSDLPDNDSTPANSSTTEDDDANAIVYFRHILINEVAWAGTSSSLPNDQWIELYNPNSISIDITGWTLTSSGGLVINLNGSIPAGGFFLLERDDNTTVSDISANQIYTGALSTSSTSGETLTLRILPGKTVDTANGDGGAWPKGGGTNYASMERQGNTAESDSVWVTNTGLTKNGKNANGGEIYGTPSKSNSNGSVAPTSTPSPTPTKRPTATFIPPAGRPIINEFLARPGFDWNQDGKVDVYDEFIEIRNIGNAEINISGWILDDDANLGSNPFILPSITLKVGERKVFYGLQTNILLGDGGDTVRLLNPSAKVYDAYTYSIAKVEDRSVCRLPDGNGSWYEDCIPTPNFTNSREGVVPSMPGGDAFESPVCDLPDTLPVDFLFAECRGFGADIWHSFFWDKFGWQGDQFIPGNMNKWESFIE